MARDAQFVALFVALHLVGIGVVATLLVMFLRADTARPWSPSDEEGGGDGGGSDRVAPQSPSRPGDGGLPLPRDARPARFRLRDETRLAERFPPRERRPAREPAPRRIPVGH